MLSRTVVDVDRYSGGSHRKRCWLRNIHLSCTRILEDCSPCQEGDSTIERGDKEISPALVWRTWLTDEKAMCEMSLEWLASVLRHVPVAASHSRTVYIIVNNQVYLEIFFFWRPNLQINQFKSAYIILAVNQIL
jgi:hypothetical protein